MNLKYFVELRVTCKYFVELRITVRNLQRLEGVLYT